MRIKYDRFGYYPVIDGYPVTIRMKKKDFNESILRKVVYDFTEEIKEQIKSNDGLLFCRCNLNSLEQKKIKDFYKETYQVDIF